MRILEVRPSYGWRHTDGRTASFYGAVPSPDAGQPGSAWQVETRGWSVVYADGTVGPHGRPAFGTREEAECFMRERNEAHAERAAMAAREAF